MSVLNYSVAVHSGAIKHLHGQVLTLFGIRGRCDFISDSALHHPIITHTEPPVYFSGGSETIIYIIMTVKRL